VTLRNAAKVLQEELCLLADKITEFASFESEVTAAQDILASADVEQQWDLLVPGVEHCESSAATAGTSESHLHAAIHPDVHGQSRDYDLALDLGLGHITAETNSLRYNMPHDEFCHLMNSLNFEQLQFVYDTVHHLKTSAMPIYSFLSGGAGTGKSYVLKALREMTEQFYKSRSGGRERVPRDDYQARGTKCTSGTEYNPGESE